jgi:hypothetical protein
MRTINSLLNAADSALQSSEILIGKTQINSSILSDIAGFGATVINLDLLPALAVYQADPDRAKVLKAIKLTLGIEPNLNQNLFEYCLNQNTQNQSLSQKRLLKQNFINASIALKLMGRTYQKINN